MFLNVALLGTVPTGRAVLRSGAKVGDAVFVTGQLGEAALAGEQCGVPQRGFLGGPGRGQAAPAPCHLLVAPVIHAPWRHFHHAVVVVAHHRVAVEVNGEQAGEFEQARLDPLARRGKHRERERDERNRQRRLRALESWTVAQNILAKLRRAS